MRLLTLIVGLAAIALAVMPMLGLNFVPLSSNILLIIVGVVVVIIGFMGKGKGQIIRGESAREQFLPRR